MPDHIIRGAKTSMVLALQSPHLVTGIVPVDNAPISATLTPEFKQYIRAMKEIEAAKVTKQSEADDILKKYEKVCYISISFFSSNQPCKYYGKEGNSHGQKKSHFLSANSC